MTDCVLTRDDGDVPSAPVGACVEGLRQLQLPPPWARHGDSISCLTSADKFNRRGGTAAINVLASSRQAAWSRRACSAASSGLIATWYKNPIRPEKSSTRTWASA